MTDGQHIVFHASVTDMFGDHGITNLAIVKKGDQTWQVLQYLMSCRVIGKGIEEAFASAIAEVARKNGAESLAFSFQKTEKNIPAQEFLSRLGDGLVFPTSSFSPRDVVTIINT